MGHAARLQVSSPNDVVPAPFQTLFPSWFAGFALAAVAIGALVPAAVISIGAANLFTRNFWKAYIDPNITDAGEAKVAKVTSLTVKVGALLVILFLPTQFALDLQLLGGIWILQTLPALMFGLYTNWFRARAAGGVGYRLLRRNVPCLDQRLEPAPCDQSWRRTPLTVYIGLLALIANVIVAFGANLVTARRAVTP
jgi:SSS family solute:Na+ symporter